jgi:hypothetical protein
MFDKEEYGLLFDCTPNIIQVRYIGRDLYWVSLFFLAVGVVAITEEEDIMTKRKGTRISAF